MKLNIKAVPAHGLELADDISAAEMGLAPDDLEVVEPCHLSVRVRKVGVGYHMTGQARVTAVQQCARCLAAVSRTVEPTFSMLYEPAGGANARTQDDLRRQDVGITFFEGCEIDLGPEIRQAVGQALPAKPLCREDCRGLCPSCGADLNEGPCSCKSKPAEAGGAMADLLKKWGGDKGSR